MRKFVRTILRTGHDSDVWPVALLLFAVLVPALCLIWFMGAAMRNERLAARQKLADAYRVQLSTSQARLQQYWQESMSALEELATTEPPPAAFARCVQSGLVDAVILFDSAGRISYPSIPVAGVSDLGGFEPKWNEAARLEHQRKFVEAAQRFAELTQAATNTDLVGRAVQAEARCWMQAGQTDAVIRLVEKTFADERFRHATDPQGRLIAANAELMAMELITNRSSTTFQSIARRLAARLNDYGNPALAAPQRRFLMKEVQQLSAQRIQFATLEAEELAAAIGESRPSLTGAPGLQRGALPGLWEFATPNRRVLACVRTDKLLAHATTASLEPSLTNITVRLVPPDSEAADAFVVLPAGEQLPGWRLALSLADQEFLESAAGRQTAVYMWTGILVLAGMGVLAIMAVRLVRRQMALARLKNDLAATVSHELKTPLSSMRVLVETLLDSDRLEEQKTREYLQLIASENERLGRLIQNFLTFSRMEQKKHAFHFSPVAAGQVVEAAIESVRGRLEAPGCRLDVQVEGDLPTLLADRDALVAALNNLLENAWKYSEDIKHIVLHARAEDDRVIFSVKDNGIGIAPRERVRIFQPFYQVNQQLSRKGGGCGLGLSIVQFIVAAHRGNVSVESEPGRGSTFSISVPVVPEAVRLGGRKEAIA